MWGIIGTIIIGFFAGLIARAIHSGDDKMGFWLTGAGDCRRGHCDVLRQNYRALSGRPIGRFFDVDCGCCVGVVRLHAIYPQKTIINNRNANARF